MPTIRASHPEVNLLVAASEQDAQRWIDRHPQLIEVHWVAIDCQPESLDGLAARKVAVTDDARGDDRLADLLGYLRHVVANGFLLPRGGMIDWELG